jgi:chromosome segregation ATPase
MRASGPIFGGVREENDMNEISQVYEAEPLPPIKYDVTQAGIQAMREKAGELPAVVASTKDRHACAEVRQHVRGVRVAVEKQRKALKADALEYSRKVDSIAKEITAAIREIEGPITERIDAYDAEVERRRQEKEEAERQRVKAIQDRIACITASPSLMVGRPIEKMEEEFARVSAIVIDDSFEEYQDEAVDAQVQAVQRLDEMIQEAVAEAQRQRDARIEAERLRAEEEAERARMAEERKKLDAERAELERQREMEAESRRMQAEADRVARQREEAEAAERRRAEEERLQAEREELEAERREMERQRAEAEVKAAAEREAKEAEERRLREEEERKQREAQDTERRDQAMADAAAHIVDGVRTISLDDARKIVAAIAAGSIPHIRFEIDAGVIQ